MRKVTNSSKIRLGITNVITPQNIVTDYRRDKDIYFTAEKSIKSKGDCYKELCGVELRTNIDVDQLIH